MVVKMGDIKVAVIGAGKWGSNIIRALQANEDCEVKYVVDVSPMARGNVRLRYPGVQCLSSRGLKAVFDDEAVTGVVVATDSPNHYSVAADAIRAGKHVFVEKPLALSASDSEALVDLAAEYKVALTVGHLMLYHPAVATLDALVKKGELGELRYICCQRLNLGIVRTTENAWWSLAPHDISMLVQLFDGLPLSIQCYGERFLDKGGQEDVVFATLIFGSGRIAHIHVSWLDPCKVRKMTVVGSEKMAVFDDQVPVGKGKLRVYEKGDSLVSDGPVREWAVGSNSLPAKLQPLDSEMRCWVSDLSSAKYGSKDSPPKRLCLPSDGQCGYDVVKILETRQQSLEAGGEPHDMVWEDLDVEPVSISSEEDA